MAGFTDPLVDCKVSKQRYRADQLFFAAVEVDGKTVGHVSALESEDTAADLQSAADRAHDRTHNRTHDRTGTDSRPHERPAAIGARNPGNARGYRVAHHAG